MYSSRISSVPCNVKWIAFNIINSASVISNFEPFSLIYTFIEDCILAITSLSVILYFLSMFSDDKDE